MKNIRVIELDKYQNEKNYQEVTKGIYKDLKNKRFVITLKFDLEENEDFQYPLEDILDKFYVNCTEHIIEDAKCRTIEVELEDGNDENFESLETMNDLASLVGKKVYNKNENGYIKLIIE